MGLVAVLSSLGTLVCVVGPFMLAGLPRAPTATLGEGFAQALPVLAGSAALWFALPFCFLATLVASMLAMRTQRQLARLSLTLLLATTLLVLGVLYRHRPESAEPEEPRQPVNQKCVARALAGEPCTPEEANGTVELKPFKAPARR